MCNVSAVSNPHIDNLILALAEVKQKAEEAAQEVALVTGILMEAMENEQVKTGEVEDGGKIHRATFVQATRIEIDEKGLREELGDEVVDQYCKKVLDRTAIEAAMEDGYLSPFKVGKHVTERKNRPSVRLSTRAAEDASVQAD